MYFVLTNLSFVCENNDLKKRKKKSYFFVRRVGAKKSIMADNKNENNDNINTPFPDRCHQIKRPGLKIVRLQKIPASTENKGKNSKTRSKGTSF